MYIYLMLYLLLRMASIDDLRMASTDDLAFQAIQLFVVIFDGSALF